MALFAMSLSPLSCCPLVSFVPWSPSLTPPPPFSPSLQFEWAVEPTSLVPTYQTVDGAMHASLTPGRWLVVGNGTSNLPQVMKEAGGKDVEVTACDFSDTVVRQMQSRQPGVEWVEMDCRSGIGEEEWDGVIDKGLIDGLYLAKDAEGVGKVSKSISRGLVAGGRWLTVR